MPFKKGDKKPENSGRKKGTPNKRTIFVEELGEFRTVKNLIELFNRTKDDSLKFAICKEFLKYEYPQKKAVNVDVENISLPEINIEGI